MRALLVALTLVGCTDAAPTTACPSGSTSDDARALRIRARLESVPSGAELVREAGASVRSICFAPAGGLSVVDHDHRIVLAEGLEEGEAAARLGHLLVHLRDGLPDDGLIGPDCDAAVERALVREASAYVREVLLQTELGARPTTLAFEFAPAVAAALPDARESIVLAYLRAHPDGAPGIDALAAGYRARCESAR